VFLPSIAPRLVLLWPKLFRHKGPLAVGVVAGALAGLSLGVGGERSANAEAAPPLSQSAGPARSQRPVPAVSPPTPTLSVPSATPAMLPTASASVARPVKAPVASRSEVAGEATASVEPTYHTPMSEDAAAERLAEALDEVMGEPPSELLLCILWGHWAHETGRGQRMKGFNYAGLKGAGPGGKSFVAWTRESRHAPKGLVRRTFRAYADEREGARDYVTLLRDRYPTAVRAARRGDVAVFVGALDQGGYFTDDDETYLSALKRLALECRRRGVADRVLAQGRAESSENGARSRPTGR
jgi:hypothetical protein